ncbi:MAG: dynamin family protein, partial [Selenomonadaceae bacterium]|nr:dynamin family protein [Selenomonadaceae bacterium]
MSKNEHLVRYEERKEKIISLLDDAGNYLRENDKTEDAESMFKLKADVEKNLFSVVLIGEFSVGKSTFLNALMHRRMLPSFKKETTATVNFLRHTSQAPHGEAGIVYYRNGTTKNLPDLNVETIARFVSTTGDTAEGTIAQTVEKVDLFLDSKFLEDGVMLVDSPGLNGITENLEAITRRQIKESHACIFMFSTDHPGTKTEFEILRDLRTECNSIFIVLNKIEEIKASEGETVESVIEHLKANYVKQFPDAKLPEIYPISAYTALAARDKNVPLERDANRTKNAAYYSELEERSRLGDFEDRLFRYLTEGERTREQLSEPVNKVGNALKYELDDLNEQIKVLEESRSTSDLEQQKLALEEAIANLQKERQSLTKPVKERFNTTMRDFRDKINARCSDICRRLETTAEEFETVDELQDFAAELPESLKKQFVNLSQRLEDDLREDLMLVVDESVEYFDGLQESLSNVSGGELKIYNR